MPCGVSGGGWWARACSNRRWDRDVSYYLLNHLSTELLVLVLVGVPTLVAVLGVAIVDRRFPRMQGAEMDDRVREVVGLVFGLLLALVIASIVTKTDDAERATAPSRRRRGAALARHRARFRSTCRSSSSARCACTSTPSSTTSGRRCAPASAASARRRRWRPSTARCSASSPRGSRACRSTARRSSSSTR